MTIHFTDEALARLKAIFAKENADAVVRIRESKIGDGWKSKIVLRLSIDEKEVDDVEFTQQSMPFVINEDMQDQYGEEFSVSLDEHGMFDVKATERWVIQRINNAGIPPKNEACMNITITEDAAKRLAELLEEEGNDAVVRIREVKVGPPWKSQLLLRLSIDERENDDVNAEAASLPFVINEELADQYGTNYAVTLDENQIPSVSVVA